MPFAPIPAIYSTQEFLSLENLTFADEAVASVFGMMLGLTAEAVSCPEAQPGGPFERAAIVGFSGSLRGSCELRLSGMAARAVTAAMLGGAPVEEGNESIDDAIGELCNMVAGGWKNRIEGLASTCSLSPPTVISGCNYKVHISSAATKLARTYRFNDQTLQLTLQCLNARG